MDTHPWQALLPGAKTDRLHWPPNVQVILQWKKLFLGPGLISFLSAHHHLLCRVVPAHPILLGALCNTKAMSVHQPTKFCQMALLHRKMSHATNISDISTQLIRTCGFSITPAILWSKSNLPSTISGRFSLFGYVNYSSMGLQCIPLDE